MSEESTILYGVVNGTVLIMFEQPVELDVSELCGPMPLIPGGERQMMEDDPV